MAFPYCQLNRMSRCAQRIMGYCDIKNVEVVIDTVHGQASRRHLDGVSPSVFRCTSTPMETGPIDACVET